MTGYVCIAMLEDPPYNMILAATEEEPKNWLDELPLPSHLLCHDYFEDAQAVERECLIRLKAQGIDARSDKAFAAKANEVMQVYQLVRDSLNQNQVLDSDFEEDNGQNVEELFDNRTQRT
ncbi:MAG: hypothetical protein ACXW04_08760 [Methylobacter sp.]